MQTLDNPFQALYERLSSIEDVLYAMANRQEQATTTPEWFDLRGLCEYLPDRPAKQTVYGWVSRGEIPYIKKGKRLIFRRQEIDEWLNSQRKPTQKEIADKAGLNVRNKKA